MEGGPELGTGKFAGWMDIGIVNSSSQGVYSELYKETVSTMAELAQFHDSILLWID